MSDGGPSLRVVRDYVDASWHKSLLWVLDELEYDPRLDHATDASGKEPPDICFVLFTVSERRRLIQTTRAVRSTFSFPSLRVGLRPSHGPVHRPSIEEWRKVFETAVGKIPNTFAIHGCSEADQLEIRARALALRSGLLRIAAELTAFLLNLAIGERERRRGRRPSGTYRVHLIEAANGAIRRLAANDNKKAS